jgi:Protein of unknown function (DUF3106)
MKLSVAIPVLTVVCLTGYADAQHVSRPPAKPPAVRPQRPERPPQKAEARPDAGLGSAEKGPGSAENLAKLLKLSPDQRNKALSGLPPARRAVIEKRLNDYQQMPEKQRAMALQRLRRMQSLPPQKQQQVRASSKGFLELPEPRRGLVKKQLNQLRPLSDADRLALMNTEEFRSKFTPAEQQMIEDICLVTPQN